MGRVESYIVKASAYVGQQAESPFALRKTGLSQLSRACESAFLNASDSFGESCHQPVITIQAIREIKAPKPDSDWYLFRHDFGWLDGGSHRFDGEAE